jgi:hypothetical protein
VIILSAGMPRAGSGWHYNLVHDLVVVNGGQDARYIRRKYHLEAILTEVNCNIGALSARRLLLALLPSMLGNTYAIKAHAAPSPLALSLIRKGYIRSTYIYRDPRAALLSAYEYGQRGLAQGRMTAFGGLTSIEEAIEFMKPYLRIWQAWINVPAALHVRYEDMLSDYDQEIGRLLEFLGIGNRTQAVETVVSKYRPGQTAAGEKGLHFHKGQPERFQSVLSQSQLEACNHAFSPFLERMGYES